MSVSKNKSTYSVIHAGQEELQNKNNPRHNGAVSHGEICNRHPAETWPSPHPFDFVGERVASALIYST